MIPLVAAIDRVNISSSDMDPFITDTLILIINIACIFMHRVGSLVETKCN